MKESELTNKIMKKVVGYEKRRVIGWILAVILGLVIFIITGAVSLWYAATILGETKSLELLTLFREDWEIIREYWRDTITTFFQELPFDSIIILAISGVILLVIIIYSLRRRGVVRKKITNIEKFQKREDDK